MQLSKEEIRKLMEEDYIMVNSHPSCPLLILNYTRKTQYEKCWNEYTLMSRGLIIDSDYNVVAMPFNKFFNYEEVKDSKFYPNVPVSEYEIFEKMDGSLGIVYFYNNKWNVATRGSFVSDQAIKAEGILKKYKVENLDPRFTYLVEIIYPENRIVVDYFEEEMLVLIGITHFQHDFTYGEIMAHITNNNIDIPVVNKYNAVTDIAELKNRNNVNEEGYVLRYKNFRMKIKFEEYCNLHSIMTNTSTKDIWKWLKEERDINYLLVDIPDEFDEWVKEQVGILQNNYDLVEYKARHNYKKIINKLAGNPSKKEFALLALQSEYSGILFKMFENKRYDDIIWKSIEPVFQKPFKGKSGAFIIPKTKPGTTYIALVGNEMIAEGKTPEEAMEEAKKITDDFALMWIAPETACIF